MAKGDWQLLVPGWNVIYMIRKWRQAKKEMESAEKELARSKAEHEAVMKRIEELKFERAHALVMGNTERAEEISKELNDIALKQIEQLLGR